MARGKSGQARNSFFFFTVGCFGGGGIFVRLCFGEKQKTGCLLFSLAGKSSPN